MNVTIYGPNLPRQDHTFHVHVTGCNETRHGFYRKIVVGGDQGGWAMDATSFQDVVENVYSDILAESGDGWESLVSEFKFFGCCDSLPYVTVPDAVRNDVARHMPLGMAPGATPADVLRHHVSGAVERGEAEASAAIDDPDRFCAFCGSDVDGNDPHHPDCTLGKMLDEDNDRSEALASFDLAVEELGKLSGAFITRQITNPALLVAAVDNLRLAINLAELASA